MNTHFPSYKDYSALAETEKRLTELREQATSLQGILDATNISAQTAQEQADEAAARALIGEQSGPTGADAHKTASAAREQADQTATELRTVTRAIALLEARLPGLEAEARQWLLREIKPAYKVAVKRMVEALDALKAANDEAEAVYMSACRSLIDAGEPSLTHLDLPVLREPGVIPRVDLAFFKDATGAFAAESGYTQWRRMVDTFLSD